MRRKGLTKIQLFLLLLAVGLVIWKSSTRSAKVDGVVVLSDMSENRVYRSGLRVDRETEIGISMVAAFETDEDRAPLAAYGWILNAEDRSIVWKPDRAAMTRDGVLGFVTDSIHISPGQYDVFYTTVGPTVDSRSNAPFLGLTPFWTNDTSKWSISISTPSGAESEDQPIRKIDPTNGESQRDDVLWSTGRMGNQAAATHMFRVLAPAQVSIYAIGEICSRECDIGYIEALGADQRVWEMTWENTIPAGGADVNRIFRGEVSLAAGVYRAGYTSNGSHAAGSWRANPPWDPDGWGMTLSNVPQSNVTSFDPWTQSRPLVDLTGVGDDALEKAQFRVLERSTYMISATGEITSQRSHYDYGWLEKNDTREAVWEMSYKNSSPAGGDQKNRVETVFLDLQPGTYTVYFQTDGTHSFSGFNSAKPDHPERWGLALFAVSGLEDGPASFELLDDSWTTEQHIAEAEAMEMYKGQKKQLIVDFEKVGNDAQLSEVFELEQPESVYVVAAGELSTSGRYDYGWIERADTGERAWEMTAKNTVYAGGRDQNRRFEGLVQLPAGTYVAKYVSDFSHSFGNFDEDSPDDSSEWGMRIFRFVR